MITLKTSKSKRSAKTHKVKPLKAASKIAKLKYFGTNARFKPESLAEPPEGNRDSIFLKAFLHRYYLHSFFHMQVSVSLQTVARNRTTSRFN